MSGRRTRTVRRAASLPASTVASKPAIGTTSATPATPPRSKALKRHLTIDDKPRDATNAPDRWEAQWNELEAMRAAHPAPVDAMGCDSFYDVAAIKSSPKHAGVSDAEAARLARYRVLVSLMLSSQTKDTENAKAMARLCEWGLTTENIVAAPFDELNELIRNVGFHNKKVVYLQRTAQILIDEHNNDVPRSLSELVALPGVGLKMAHLTLQAAYGLVLGVSVDTHVHRISQRLGWTKKGTKTPGQTAAQLEEWLPKDKWRRVNHMLVGHGQTICTPTNPRCDECSLFAKSLCPRVGLGRSGVKRPKVDDIEDLSD